MWFPTFEIDTANSTGRFRNASGTLLGVAINPPFDPSMQLWPFDWFLDGEIDLGRRREKVNPEFKTDKQLRRCGSFRAAFFIWLENTAPGVFSCRDGGRTAVYGKLLAALSGVLLNV